MISYRQADFSEAVRNMSGNTYPINIGFDWHKGILTLDLRDTDETHWTSKDFENYIETFARVADTRAFKPMGHQSGSYVYNMNLDSVAQATAAIQGLVNSLNWYKEELGNYNDLVLNITRQDNDPTNPVSRVIRFEGSIIGEFKSKEEGFTSSRRADFREHLRNMVNPNLWIYFSKPNDRWHSNEQLVLEVEGEKFPMGETLGSIQKNLNDKIDEILMDNGWSLYRPNMVAHDPNFEELRQALHPSAQIMTSTPNQVVIKVPYEEFAKQVGFSEALRVTLDELERKKR